MKPPYRLVSAAEEREAAAQERGRSGREPAPHWKAVEAIRLRAALLGRRISVTVEEALALVDDIDDHARGRPAIKQTELPFDLWVSDRDEFCAELTYLAWDEALAAGLVPIDVATISWRRMDGRYGPDTVGLRLTMHCRALLTLPAERLRV